MQFLSPNHWGNILRGKQEDKICIVEFENLLDIAAKKDKTVLCLKVFFNYFYFLKIYNLFGHHMFLMMFLCNHFGLYVKVTLCKESV